MLLVNALPRETPQPDHLRTHSAGHLYLFILQPRGKYIREKRGKSVLELINGINTSAAGLVAPSIARSLGRWMGRAGKGCRE